MDRIDKATADRLRKLQSDHIAKYESDLARMRGKKGMSRKNILKFHSEAFFREAVDLLSGNDVWFPTHAACLYHNAQCPIMPAKAPGVLHLEVGGNICTPWSTQNQDAREWLSEESLSALVWLASLAHHAPDAALGECTPAFPESAFGVLMPMFSAHSCVFGPDLLGLPISRVRRYTMLLNSNACKPMVDLSLKTVSEMVGRKVVATGMMFLQASPKQVKKHLDRMAGAKWLPPRSGEDAYDGMMVLSTADRLRLRGCFEQARGSARHDDIFLESDPVERSASLQQ